MPETKEFFPEIKSGSKIITWWLDYDDKLTDQEVTTLGKLGVNPENYILAIDHLDASTSITDEKVVGETRLAYRELRKKVQEQANLKRKRIIYCFNTTNPKLIQFAHQHLSELLGGFDLENQTSTHLICYKVFIPETTVRT